MLSLQRQSFKILKVSQTPLLLRRVAGLHPMETAAVQAWASRTNQETPFSVLAGTQPLDGQQSVKTYLLTRTGRIAMASVFG